MYDIGIFKKDSIIGLDIGSSSVRLVQFVVRPDGLHLAKAAIEEIAQVDDQALSDKVAVIALRKVLRGVELKRSKVIVGINCPKTTIKRVTAPYMPKAELQEGIRLEAKSYFPFSIENSLLDYEIVKEIIENGVRKYELLVATSPFDTVNRYLSILNKVGIKPSMLTPACYALQKLMDTASPKKEDIGCLVDIGNRMSEIVIFEGKNLVFSRTIPVAGEDFTKALTSVLATEKGKTQLSMQEAEKIKREVGIPRQGDTNMIDGKISSIQVLSMLRSPLQQLVSEIDRCFDYYREESAGKSINSIRLLGRGASIKGLPELLTEELGIEAAIAKPAQDIKILQEAKEYTERPADFGIALGVALGGDKGINLLPPEIKQETQRMLKRAVVMTLGVTFVLVAIFVYIGMRIQLGNLNKKIPVARMEFASLIPQLNEAEMHHLASTALSGEPYWDDIFIELSNLIPEDIYLTQISMKDKSIRLEGIVSSKEKEKLLSDFIFTLEKGIFSNVRLVMTKQLKGKDANTFELKCWVDR